MNSDVVVAATSASPLTPTHTYIGRELGFYLPVRTVPYGLLRYTVHRSAAGAAHRMMRDDCIDKNTTHKRHNQAVQVHTTKRKI